jgi:hypothetical protein
MPSFTLSPISRNSPTEARVFRWTSGSGLQPDKVDEYKYWRVVNLPYQ